MLKPLVLRYATMIAKKLGKDFDGDLFVIFGRTYWVDIIRSVVSPTSMNSTIPSNVPNIKRDIICRVASLRKDADRTMVVNTIFNKKISCELIKMVSGSITVIQERNC